MKLKCPVTNDLLADFRLAIAEETEKVKTRIVANVSTGSRRKAELRQYIQSHQQRLITLSSQLLQYTHPEKLTHGSDSVEPPLLCHYSYRSLEDLLSFMERHFTGYFNPDAWIPMSYRMIAVQEIRYQLEVLEQEMIKAKVDHNIQSVVFMAFREFLDEECANEITYSKVKYLKTLKTELWRIMRDQSTRDSRRNDMTETNDLIRMLLVSLNFNSAAFFTYYTNFIVQQVNSHQVPAQRLEKLAFFLKEVNQVRDRLGVTFDVRYQPLKEQIATWIAEELNYRERNHQLPLGFTEGDTLVPANVKIQLDLSVAQLACLIKAFVDEGIIQNRNLSQLIRLIVSVIKTKRSEVVSAESFRLRYYNIEDNIRLTVAKKLRSLSDKLMKSP